MLLVVLSPLLGQDFARIKTSCVVLIKELTKYLISC